MALIKQLHLPDAEILELIEILEELSNLERVIVDLEKKVVKKL